jgi:hypothetical protein
MKEILTIAVPLYKEIFLERLDEIVSQSTIGVRILIVNDNPSLNINDVIERKYNSIDNITIISNKINLGLGANIANCFYYTKTKWMWLLGDDDILIKGSVKTILNKISSSNAALLKFSYDHDKPNGRDETKYQDCSVKGLDGLINSLYKGANDFNIGSMIFMSNSVFNMSKVGVHTNIAYKNASTYAPHFSVILEYLSENNCETIQLFSEKIVINYHPSIDDKWTRFIVALGILNIQYMILNMSENQYKKLINSLYCFINFRFIFLELFIEGYSVDNFNKSKFIYRQLYLNGLAKTNFYGEKVVYHMLYFFMNKPRIVFRFFAILAKYDKKYDIASRIKNKGFDKKI